MKIFGIGTDIINIQRMKKAFVNKKQAFKTKVFSKNEINYCEKKRDPFPFYAKRFAAKEALSKALGTGIRKDIHFKQIEIKNDLKGKPSIKLTGSTKAYLVKKNKKKRYSIYLSLSDDAPWAQATVIISTND